MSTLAPFLKRTPSVPASAFVAPTCVVVGAVTLGEDSSLWYHVTARGDVGEIVVGAGSNVQDNAVLHCSAGRNSCRIGNGVSVGHGAIVHGCTLHDACLVGMGATVLDDCTVGKGAIVAAGALVPERTEIAPGELWAGVPARRLRAVRPHEAEMIERTACNYRDLARQHRAYWAAS